MYVEKEEDVDSFYTRRKKKEEYSPYTMVRCLKRKDKKRKVGRLVYFSVPSSGTPKKKKKAREGGDMLDHLRKNWNKGGLGSIFQPELWEEAAQKGSLSNQGACRATTAIVKSVAH